MFDLSVRILLIMSCERTLSTAILGVMGLSKHHASLTSIRESLIREYFAMWVERDFRRFDALFANACVYEECYGPIYTGLSELHAWIADMLDNQHVSAWDIHDFIHGGDSDTVIAIWTFSDNESTFDGASVIDFDQDNKISRVREYQSTHKRRHPYA